jgi:hypothetical protein
MHAWKISVVFSFFAFLSASIGSAEENASNPLAAVNNTDIRFQTFDNTNGSQLHDLYIDGAYMMRPNLKLKYELHYNSTDITGTREQGFEKIILKAIYFPSESMLNETWGIRTAVGLEWSLDLGDAAKGIGAGADTLAPFGGIAFANSRTGLTLIPLVQHFASYSGPNDVSQTALRLIALQPFAKDYWAKLDLIAPYDWNRDAIPASAEIQLGYNINKQLAVYGDILVGLGSDRSFDGGLGVGVRLKY